MEVEAGRRAGRLEMVAGRRDRPVVAETGRRDRPMAEGAEVYVPAAAVACEVADRRWPISFKYRA